MKKISKIQTYLIILRSILITAMTSSICIVRGFFKINSRDWVNLMLHRWADQLLRLIKSKYIIINPHGVEPETGKATIIMCNHTSIYDIPLCFKAFPNHSIRMLAKKELSTIPLFGAAMTSAEFPFIDRKNRTQAMKDLTTARSLMESGIVMCVYPEGTRSLSGKLAPFKKGAFITAIEAKATIIPIGIRGAFEILPSHSTKLNLNCDMELHIGEPINAADYTLENKQELVNRVHDLIKSLAGEE